MDTLNAVRQKLHHSILDEITDFNSVVLKLFPKDVMSVYFSKIQTNFLIWTLSNEYPRQEVFTIMKKIKKVTSTKKKISFITMRGFFNSG